MVRPTKGERPSREEEIQDQVFQPYQRVQTNKTTCPKKFQQVHWDYVMEIITPDGDDKTHMEDQKHDKKFWRVILKYSFVADGTDMLEVYNSNCDKTIWNFNILSIAISLALGILYCV